MNSLEDINNREWELIKIYNDKVLKAAKLIENEIIQFQ